MKSSKLLIVLLSVLLVSLTGCYMESKEAIAAVKECKDAGLEPKQYINQITNETSHIRCDIPDINKAN